MIEKIRVYVDMDGVLADFRKSYHAKKTENLKYPQAVPGFWENLDPMPGAIEGYNKLKEIFDVWILTAPSVKNPICYTEKRIWIEKHLGFDECNRLIISPNKSLLKGDYLIDDTLMKGVPDFEGEHIHFGISENFMNWEDVINYIPEMENNIL